MKLKCELTVGPTASHNCEKNGKEAGDVGTSISISGDIHVDSLVDLFTTPQIHQQMLAALYGSNDQLVVPDIGSFTLKSEFEKVNVSFSGPVLEDERLAFKGGKLKDVVLTPKHGCAVGFKGTLYVYADEEQYKDVPKLLRHEMLVNVTSGVIAKPKGDTQTALDMPPQDDKKSAETAGAAPVH